MSELSRASILRMVTELFATVDSAVPKVHFAQPDPTDKTVWARLVGVQIDTTGKGGSGNTDSAVLTVKIVVVASPARIDLDGAYAIGTAADYVCAVFKPGASARDTTLNPIHHLQINRSTCEFAAIDEDAESFVAATIDVYGFAVRESGTAVEDFLT